MLNYFRIFLLLFVVCSSSSYATIGPIIKSIDDLYMFLKNENKVGVSKSKYFLKIKSNPIGIIQYKFLSKEKKLTLLAELAFKEKRIKSTQSLQLLSLFEEIGNGDVLLAKCLKQKNCNPIKLGKNKNKDTNTKNNKHIKQVKIVSWNLQNFTVNNKVKFKRIKYYINSFFLQGVDIIALQEIKDFKNKQINIKELSSGYIHFVSEYLGRNRHKERYVVLINPKLYKKLNVNPFKIREIKTRSFKYFQRPPYGVVFGNKFLFLNIHLVYGNSKIERIKELRQLRQKTKELLKYYRIQNNNYIIAGDFNLDKNDIKQVFKKAYITTTVLTTNKNSYDHIITNQKIKKDLISKINRVGLSDHSPIRVMIEINTKSTKSKRKL